MGVIHTKQGMMRKGGWYGKRPSHINEYEVAGVLILGVLLGLLVRCLQYA